MQLTQPHISSLLAQCKQGDQRAQLKVYDLYYKAMYNTARRIVHDAAEAEDIMQEAFLKAFSKLDSFREDSSFGSWLKRIVVNHSIRAYHQQIKMQKVAYEHVEHEVMTHHQRVVLEKNEVTAAKVKRVLSALNSLKENYRLSLTLHLIEGYDYEEVSTIMEISYANCRTMISRAKEKLRKILTNEYQ
ncbi:RNA polymerase sigma factor RpoE [Gangjinia marincola]|uniref:RNA polymerase sigma factor RpoE n=1 Tax=Gangjinia marincola TaxID=578463 RepID=A0ABP3XUU8_9FLAO